jgi:glycosyltransferase involved in cell wall biosynthesis
VGPAASLAKSGQTGQGESLTAEDPIVDVGIPAYRRPDYLTEAIESVLSQTLTRWRLFISEDGPGSSEVAAAVAPYLTDPRIHYSVAGERLGPPGNKNILLRAGSAPFVAILDDDDRWRPTVLTRRVSFLEEHPQCAFVFSAINEIDEQGRWLRETGFFGAEGVVESKDFVHRLLQGYFVRPASLLVRRTAYQAVGQAFDESFPYIYDEEMWFRLAVRFPVGYLAECDADHRIHHSQDSFGVRPADQILRFLDRAEAVVEREPWAAQWSQRERNRTRSQWLLSATLDALERGEERRASAHLRRALRLHPWSVRDRRAIAALVGLTFGRRAGRLVGGSARALVRRQRWRRARRREKPEQSVG